MRQLPCLLDINMLFGSMI